MIDQEQHALLRRLLQRLQQRVGAALVGFVDGVDDADAPAAERRFLREEVRECPDLVDADILREFALFVELTVH